MNLVGDPWIPVIFHDGRSELVSLHETFAHGEEIRDLVATPPQRIALTRLLVCVAQAALDGPADEEDWAGCLPRIAPAALAYLERHRNAFELYADGSEGAFLQVPNLEPTDNAVVDKLDFGLAAGNNATLFDHGACPEGREHPPAWCALNLLTFQCFSPGGTIGVSTWDGTWTTNDGKKPSGPGSSDHAPCLDCSPLHTVVRRKDVLRTVHANLLSKRTVSELASMTWGMPVWERLPRRAADAQATELAMSYLGRLVPVSRAIRLTRGSTCITLVNAISYPKFPEAREPSTTVVKTRDERQLYLGIDLSKHPWRELSSVLAAGGSRMEGRALVLSHVRPEDGGDTVDLWTGGLVAAKGKVVDVAEWSFHLPLSLLGDASLLKYGRGVELASRAGRSIGAAVGGYFEDLSVSEFKTKVDPKKGKAKYVRFDEGSRKHRQAVVAKATAWFWGELDATYGVLVDTAGVPEKRLGEDWYKTVYRTMQEAYRRACPHETPRQIRAFAKGKKKLRLKRPED